jgi:hypothetical protein
MVRHQRLLILLLSLFLFTHCSRSNNVLLGRVEAEVGGHTIAVTDCYRTSVESPHQVEGLPGGKVTYRWTPCRDADISISGEELVVNGRRYGRLNRGDAVVVDHGKVLINEREAQVTSESK